MHMNTENRLLIHAKHKKTFIFLGNHIIVSRKNFKFWRSFEAVMPLSGTRNMTFLHKNGILWAELWKIFYACYARVRKLPDFCMICCNSRNADEKCLTHSSVMEVSNPYCNNTQILTLVAEKCSIMKNSCNLVQK